MPTLLEIIRDFRGQLLDAERATVEMMLDTWQGVEQALVDEFERLVAEIGDGVATSQELYRLGRYQQLLTQVNEELMRWQTLAESGIAAGQREAVRLGALMAQGLLAELGTIAVLPVAAIENILALAQAGRPLAVLLEAMYGQAAQGITRELLNGLAVGLSPRDIAQRIVERGLTDALNHVLLVMRDQYNRAHRLAGLELYRASGVVEGYIRIAAHNNRTCPACLALDGEFFELDEPFESHPQCRCTTIPVVRGVKRPELQRGRDWFAEQPITEQRLILGNGRWELWKDGRLDFDDLVKKIPNEVWGASVVPTPLGELAVN